ncbi:phosphoenolpyruvate synthase [Candidatus Peregrinibacteria bacterium]|nr:phosphoenolpyruvate synthase [Candidatus Peregrinibacteria bacterium]
MKSKKFVLWFKEIGKNDIALVGGKNASLGEMFRNLAGKGVAVPNGFAITVTAYRYFVKYNGIDKKLKKILGGLNIHDVKNLQKCGAAARALFEKGVFPKDLEHEIRDSYKKLSELLKIKNPDVAIRSSATAEDLPDASFAGQQESYLNIEGGDSVLEHTKKAFASLFTDRAISYRHDKNFCHFSVYLSVTVQKMVRSDLASSGVMFTCDTESGFDKVVFITGSWGLGEMVVQGAVSPDQFYVFKPSLEKVKKAIIEKTLGFKDKKMVYDQASPKGRKTKIVAVPNNERKLYVLENEEIVQLAKWAVIIEKHYGKNMDIEWAKDGETGDLYIVQARPETIHGAKEGGMLETYVLDAEQKNGRLIVQGQAVGNKIGRGMVRVVASPDHISQFKPGEILVTDMTNPDWEPIMKVAQAIITNKGGKTCHAAIVSRELGVPCVIGTGNATKLLKTGMEVTVDCSTGTGDVYSGLLNFRVEKLNLKELPRTHTRIFMNIGIPEKAFVQAQIPTDGVGLAREEFIINSHIGIHPLALINYPELAKSRDPKLRKIAKTIEDRTHGYEEKSKFFIDRLSYGIARIAAAFHPHDVIVRMSDFKSNEYANLAGGELYEPHEDNPMIGWRGASRYYDPKYKQAFGLECEAFKKVRDEMGFTNVIAMIPFCRTPQEGRRVIETMNEFGLKQGKNGLQIYMMVEVPSNIIMIEEFTEVFDGFSIGSNDLTQLTLGLDRDSEIVAHLFDERSEAIKKSVARAIAVCKKKKKKIGICGQAPSDFPDFASFLVKCGISSISLNPDTVVKTRIDIAKEEKRLGM